MSKWQKNWNAWAYIRCDAVEENQVLAVIEAMKMETSVVARMSGHVEEIFIEEGNAVKAGELLITINCC